MKTIQAPIVECNPGDVLAIDVINEIGTLLVAKGTTITEYIINKLMELDIKSVSIFKNNDGINQDSQDRVIDTNIDRSIFKIKELISRLAGGYPLDYDMVLEVSDFIAGNISESQSIITYLNHIKNNDDYTYNHCFNTAFYSMLMGTWLNFSNEDILLITQAGLLHDIGKTQIPPNILNKKGPLTKDEYEIVKNHTVLGYGILSENGNISTKVKRAVLMHHERIDNSGYPFKASSDCIDVFSKIVAIADVFDAMTSKRVYKGKVSPFKVFEMFLTEGMGSFDPSILTKFLRNIAPFYVGCNVILSNGENGQIVYIPPHDIINPIIRTKGGCLDLSKESKIEVKEII